MTSLDLVVPVKNHLLKNLKVDEVKREIIERIQKFPNYNAYKNDVEFLLLVCNMIEHLIIKKDKIDKKQLLIEIYKQVFNNLNNDEQKALEQNVEFLWNNKKIKKVSYYKLFKTGLFEWCKKRFF